MSLCVFCSQDAIGSNPIIYCSRFLFSTVRLWRKRIGMPEQIER